MRAGKYLVVTAAALAVLGGAACKKKKPNLPPQTQPPAITQPEPETPPAQPEPEPTPPVTTPPAAQPEPEPTAPAPKPKPRKRKRTTPASTENAGKPGASKPAATTKPAETPAPKPIDNVQISVELPQNVANQRRQQTEDLLNTAEVNLKKVNRSLTDGEQSMQRQVRNFITQSRLAIQDGDFERAYTLATKAQQLSQELVK